MKAPRWLAIAMLCSSTAGCLVFHGRSNAPGVAEIDQPPKCVRCRRVQEPKDPGERLVTLSTGLVFGGGPTAGRDDGVRGTYALALESSLHFTSRDRSHNCWPGLLPLADGRHWGDSSWALTLGVNVLEYGGARGINLGPLYGELQIASFENGAPSAAAFGWAVDVGERIHGPQFTLYALGIFHFRVTHLIGRGTDILFGTQFKLPVTWVRSR